MRRGIGQRNGRWHQMWLEDGCIAGGGMHGSRGQCGRDHGGRVVTHKLSRSSVVGSLRGGIVDGGIGR